MTILKITPEGKRTLKHMEKDEWLEVLLNGFSNEERLQLLSMVKRLIKNTVRFAKKESPVPAHHRV